MAKNDPKTAARIRGHLASLYGEPRADALLQSVLEIAGRRQIQKTAASRLDESSAVLIAYGDHVKSEGRPPLKVLDEFLSETIDGAIDHLHLLPFYPWSSDDGFSVVDYLAVNPALGTWDDVKALGARFKLAFDAVINHISSQSAWFQGRLAGEAKYENFFITPGAEADLSGVVRPRTTPLLSPYTAAEGERKFWTTFSADQVDLNFAEPEVLLAILDVLLFYAAQGARILRLDAVAFLWKRPGTPCLHLPQTHETIRLIRAVLDLAAPHVQLLSETNVPHEENISYFGQGDEAQMVYQFTLPPLVAHGILRGEAAALTGWARSLKHPPAGSAFFNFLASHDGVGMRPAQGHLPQEEIDFLVSAARDRGGRVSSRKLADGGEAPYELNISYLDLLAGAEDKERGVAKFLLAHAILMAMPGVPAVYFHSLFGSRSWNEGVEKTGANRAINRERLDLSKIREELKDPNGLRSKIFSGIKRLLAARASNPAFDPYGAFRFPRLHHAVFAVERQSQDGHSVLCLHNLSGETVEARVEHSSRRRAARSSDILSRGFVDPAKPIRLEPYQAALA